MRKLFLIASAAAMAASMPALAKENDKGKGNGRGNAAAHENQRGDHRRGADRAGKRDADRGKDHASKRGDRHASGRKTQTNETRQEARAVRERFEDRMGRRDDRRGDRREDRRDRYDDHRYADLRGCSPGLAKKRNGCLPPGQAKRSFRVGQHFQRASFSGYNLPNGYRDLYYDNDDSYYRYDQGNIYRVDTRSNLISGLIPLLGGGFSVGGLLPSGYDVYNVPVQYRDLYSDTDDDYYRYGDNAIYRVDPETSLVESVVALLAGDLNVGQALPSGYDVYNVPLDYRDDYADTDEDFYRYADGNIYQVDAKTQIIQAIVQAIL